MQRINNEILADRCCWGICCRCLQCPSLAYHLVGAKKIQQVLSKNGVLERFFPDDAEVSQSYIIIIIIIIIIIMRIIIIIRHS
jgi:hypothetical protein